MENSSTSPPSLAWPTRWPKEAFKFGPSALWLIFVAGAFVAGQIAGTLVVAASGGLAALRAGDIVQQMIVMVFTWAFVVPIAWWCLPTVTRVSRKNLGFTMPNFGTVGIAAAGAVVATIVVGLVSALVQNLTHNPHPQAVALAFTTIHQPIALMFIIVASTTIVPIAEETIFRLFFFNLGLRYGGFWLGGIISAVLFGLAHGDIYNAAPLAACGLLLCAVYYYSKNAYASMIAHGLFNAITIVALLVDPSAAKG